MFEVKKIGIVRRLSAWLLDAILLAVLAAGFIYIISLICNFSHAQAVYTENYAAWDAFREAYIPDVAEYYGFSYSETESGYTVTKKEDGTAATLDDVLGALEASKGEDPATAEAYAAYHELPSAAAVGRHSQYVYSLLFMMVSLGILLAFVVLEFIVPVCLKNGQTVGKKIFGICLVRPDCVRVANVAVFARAVLGKYAIETMFPLLLVFLFFFGAIGILAPILLLALLILNAVLFFATKNRTPIHDVFANTVAADMRLQMIFASEEELIEKKNAQHTENIKKSQS